MTRIAPFFACLLGMVLLPASVVVRADLTLTGRSGMIAMNMPNIGHETLYLKKNLLRRDLNLSGRAYTYLYDLDHRETTSIDHLLRQAEVRSLPAASKKGEGAAADKDLSLKMTSTGQQRKLQHWDCAELRLTARLPAELGQESATLLITGTAWLARKAPEKGMVSAFVKATDSDDFFMAVPQLTGPQAQGVNAVLRRLLLWGTVCAADIQMSYEGGGRMADLGRRLDTRMTLVWDELSSKPLAEDLFAIPQGYRVVHY